MRSIMIYDMIIVGGGPAGMTAARYALRNGKTALVIEKNGFVRCGIIIVDDGTERIAFQKKI